MVPVPVAPWQIVGEAVLREEAGFADAELLWFAQGEAQEAPDEGQVERLDQGVTGRARAWLSKWRLQPEPA
jgi:hypothetical protein